MNGVERVREQTATTLEYYYASWGKNHESFLEVADKILAKKGVCVKADDQSLPENPFDDVGELPRSTGYYRAQDDMLTPDSQGRVWVKIEKKGTKE